MKNHEARFILGAYRPDGRDASDPMFAKALEQASRDPELRNWLEQQRALDGVVATKLRELSPPPELREAILAGVRASQPRRRWWRSPGLLAAAAAIALLAAVSFTIGRRGLSSADFATFALNDLASAHSEHVGFPPEFADLQAQLSTMKLPLTADGSIAIDLDELRRKHCRSLRFGKREIFEICFFRDGNWYHLYAGQRSDFQSREFSAKPLFASHDEYAASAWADSKHIFALVTHAGEAALRPLL